MKENHVRIIGMAMVVVGLMFSVHSLFSVRFDPNPSVWFSASYYVQFIPLYIAVTFLLCGLFVVLGYSHVNVYLAVFGHATSEEILFSLIGLTTSPLPVYAMVIFLPFSFLALWVAYMNTLEKKPVSVVEAIFGIVFSTAFIILPRYM